MIMMMGDDYQTDKINKDYDDVGGDDDDDKDDYDDI